MHGMKRRKRECAEQNVKQECTTDPERDFKQECDEDPERDFKQECVEDPEQDFKQEREQDFKQQSMDEPAQELKQELEQGDVQYEEVQEQGDALQAQPNKRNEPAAALLERIRTGQLATTAQTMRSHIGISDAEWQRKTGKDALTSFMTRYMNKHGARWHYEHQQRFQDNCWVATLVIPSLSGSGRRFTGTWRYSQAAAEETACVTFQFDEQVQEIRRNLPPTMKKIKDYISLDTRRKKELAALGYTPAVVQHDMVAQAYNGFRSLGCRTAEWDGWQWDGDDGARP
ncbi:unnamed protein product [Symbiodinium natans]|uniref:Uncharacterized protein n=1 Tax=Symbiodinium natans TaxID=878477 RepID=A0A812U223_9DINO|nr:unnamed protein product [Symbiodinium natans]